MKAFSMSPHLKKLTSILSDHEYHSGTDIGKQLGLTRSGVWKLIKQLSALGIDIESGTNKGYKTENILEFLDPEQIKKNISDKHLHLLNDFFIYDSMTSTNDYLVTHAKQIKNSNAVCFAEHQTAGRGRLGRTWVSPFLSNIYMSLLWNFHFDMTALSGLHILTGISVMKALQKITKIQGLQLKWPNDILWNHCKLGGILIDIIGEYNGLCSVVIGIGLNVNMPEQFTSHIEKPNTAINRITHTTLSRNHLAGILLDQLISDLIQFSHAGLSDFINDWEKYDCLAGNLINISTATESLTGIAKGIDEHGRLLLETKDKNKIAVNSGDASIL